jgi:hypothetical protein
MTPFSLNCHIEPGKVRPIYAAGVKNLSFLVFGIQI